METQNEQTVDENGVPTFETDYYSVLDVHPSATRLEIREAFLKMKSAYGTDSPALYSLMDESSARDSLVRIEKAFRVLNDPYQREKYDKDLGIVSSGHSAMYQGLSDGSEIEGQTEKEQWQVERIATFRDVQEEAEPERPFQQEEVAKEEAREESKERKFVTTSRSTLQVTQLVATSSSKESIQQKFANLVEDGDKGDGDLYRQLREIAGVSLKEMFDRTKIGIDSVEAIETNAFDKLPPSVYVSGFVRSYLRYLRVPNEDEFVKAYSKRLKDWLETKNT